jgi:hypothetical protein
MELVLDPPAEDDAGDRREECEAPKGPDDCLRGYIDKKIFCEAIDRRVKDSVRNRG